MRPILLHRRMNPEAVRPALIAQAGHCLATGMLPLVSRRSFEAATGPKREWWLVQTVGALVTIVGASVGARDSCFQVSTWPR